MASTANNKSIEQRITNPATTYVIILIGPIALSCPYCKLLSVVTSKFYIWLSKSAYFCNGDTSTWESGFVGR